MPESGLRDQLIEAARSVGTLTPPTLEQLQARRGRRRYKAGAVAGSFALIVALAVAVALTRGSSYRPPRRGPGPTADQLAEFRWSRLPPAPIAGRSEAAGVWTGRQMFIWGGVGDRKGQFYNDGALYEPDTRTWTKLPSSPLSPRAFPAAVLAGHSVIIWGGTTHGSHLVTDGAIYDTVTGQWRPLPTAPNVSSDLTSMVWTGSQVLLLTAKYRQGSVQASSYDLQSNTWHALPDLHPTHASDIGAISAVATNTATYVWIGWDHIKRLSPTKMESGGGTSSYLLPQHATRWRTNSLGDLVSAPVWTGRAIILPASPPFCATCLGPRPTGLTSELIRPDKDTVTHMRHGPLDDDYPYYAWTGRAVLAFDSTDDSSNTTGEGVSAAWNPQTNRWRVLPQAPLGSYFDAVTIWTGHALLVWGMLHHPARGQATTPPSIPAGLEFSAP